MARKMNEMNTANIAMEKNLTAHGMGLPEIVSEVDALVFEDDEILVGRWNAKSTRKDRFKATDLHARRLAKKAICRTGKELFVATHTGKDGIAKGHKVTWHSNCGKGKKVWNKKTRREHSVNDVVVTYEAIARWYEGLSPETYIDTVYVYDDDETFKMSAWFDDEPVFGVGYPQEGMLINVFGTYQGYSLEDWLTLDKRTLETIRSWIAEGHLDDAHIVMCEDTPSYWDCGNHTELSVSISESTTILDEWKHFNENEAVELLFDEIIANEKAKLAQMRAEIDRIKAEIANLKARREALMN